MNSDPRIPITLLPDAAALGAWLEAHGPAALLTDGDPLPGAVAAERFEPRPLHRFGCACCAGRPAAAVALDRLFQGRARGRSAWFDHVAALGSPAALDQVRAVLRDDALTMARFRAG